MVGLISSKCRVYWFPYCVPVQGGGDQPHQAPLIAHFRAPISSASLRLASAIRNQRWHLTTKAMGDPRLIQEAPDIAALQCEVVMTVSRRLRQIPPARGWTPWLMRRITAGRSARSAALLVGWIPGLSRKVQSACLRCSSWRQVLTV